MMSTPDQFEQDALSEQVGKKLKIFFVGSNKSEQAGKKSKKFFASMLA